MHIECINGSPIVDTLDHLPRLPLWVRYTPTVTRPTEQDELAIYHALPQHDRVRNIELVLVPSILHKAVSLMAGHFPMLEYLRLSFESTTVPDKNSPPLTLPKAFLAPKLYDLDLSGVRLPKRLRLLISTVSLDTLKLKNIQTSNYFRPRLLVARLAFLPKLRYLVITFSVPIPRPSTERELLGEQGALVTLPSLNIMVFKGVGAYLESLVAQIRVPLLGKLGITLFNQIAFPLPHLSNLVKITELIKSELPRYPRARVEFSHDGVAVRMAYHSSLLYHTGSFVLKVMCKQLDWQISCVAQICNQLVPTLSGVKELVLKCDHDFQIPTALENGAIDETAWHELLRSFTGLTYLNINKGLLEELSRALQVGEVGLDPGFLPNLGCISTDPDLKLFTSFVDARQIAGRPVKLF